MIRIIRNFIQNIIEAFKSDSFKNERSGIWFKRLLVLLPIVAVILLSSFIYLTCSHASVKNLTFYLRLITDISIISCVVLLIWGIFSDNYYNLVVKYLKVKNQLNIVKERLKGINDIDAFTNHYYELKEEFEKIDHIKNIWHEFCETLIPVKNGYEVVLYKNTAQTEDYINSDTIINQQISISRCESIPGILTGLGLAGTFIAITIALLGFDTSDGALEQSVQGLLSGLSIKFISSLAGIITSILFIAIKDKLIGNLEKSLYEVQIDFNHIFPRRTTESFLNDILFEMKEQTENMKSFFLDIGFQDAIKKAMSSGVENLKPEFLNIRESINVALDTMNNSKNELFGKLDFITSEFNNSINNLNNNITNSLSGSISNSLGGLTNDFGNAIRELKGAMDEFKNMKQESSASLIENMVNELKSCIVNMQNSFTEAIIGGSGDTIGNLQQSLVDASGYLSNSQEMFTNFMNTIQEQTTRNSIERDESVNRVVAQTIEKVSNVNDFVQNSMNTQNDKINDWINTINSYISEIHNNEMNVKNNYSELLNNLNVAIEKQKEVVSGNTAFISQMVSASNQLNNSTNNILSVQNSLSDNLNHSNSCNSEFISKLQEFNSLNREINSQLESNIDILRNQSSVYDGINNNTSHMIETLTNNINEFTAKSQIFQNQMFEEFGKNLGAQLSGLSSIVQQQSEIVEDLSDTLETIHK